MWPITRRKFLAVTASAAALAAKPVAIVSASVETETILAPATGQILLPQVIAREALYIFHKSYMAQRQDA